MSNFLEFIEEKKIGLDIGLPKLNDAINGILQGMLYLIGGKSGSGKTTFLDYSFFLNALISARKENRKIKIFYYSFEISEYKKTAKMISYALYSHYNISLSDMDIMNRTKLDITEYKHLIKEHYHQYKKFIDDNVVFTWIPTNPTQIYKDLINHAYKNGKFIRTEIKNDEGEVIKINEKYIPNDPDELVLCIVDHLRLSKKERGFGKKENMEKIAEYSLYFRNICNYSAVLLQQLNRGVNSIDRQKLKGDDLLPNDSDFSDSGDIFQDADVVLTCFNPSEYGLTRSCGVNVGKNHRVISVLKSRVGENNVSVIVNFNGKVNYIAEID